jgi:RIP metalloprotease RseP
MKKLQGDHSEKQNTETAENENNTSATSDPVEELPPAAPWKRIVVAVAGPLGNIVLALICACLIAWFAPDEAIGSSTTLGHVSTSSKAYDAGLRPGDTIRAINGKNVASWHELIQECYLAGGKSANVSLSIENFATTATKTITLPLEDELAGKSDLYFIHGLLPKPVYYLATDIAPDSLVAQMGLPKTGLIQILNKDANKGILTFEMVDCNFENPLQKELNYTITPPYDETKTKIYMVLEGSPAAHAGLQVGDEIVEVNNTKTFTVESFTSLLKTEDSTIENSFIVRRAGQNDLVEIKIRPDEKTKQFGFLFGKAINGADACTYEFHANLSPNEDLLSSFLALQAAGFKLQPTLVTKQQFPWMKYQAISDQLIDDASGIFRVLQALVAPREGSQESSRAAKGLGGPVMIFSILTQLVANGFWISIGFLRLICINLAILNLLPLPVLDGGHTMFALYAIIRRKEPSAKVIGIITNIFAFLLIGVMIWFLFSDIMRFIG